ncbi:endonuclease [Sediminibacter sp. Hel_I_10]|uniref:endonuclease n=1 Tax=Sediminibacter sp. Hel_I_10 TaxID=1392490 RepID=UPI00068C14FE|nr:endonuclease [Sediminibacter sp. Hel_I_10]
MKHFYFIALLTFISISAFAQLQVPVELQDYYDATSFSISDGEQLKDFVATTTNNQHTNILSYGQRHQYLYTADANLDDASEVVLMYSGEIRNEQEYLSGNNTYPTQTFNTEHVFPQSMLADGIYDVARADLHHLRSCDVQVNSNRGNKPFANNTSGGTYENLGSTWFPGDDWKGDVARMVMYINLKYNEPFTDVGTLDLFIEWNIEDPVSDFEINRNEVIADAQGNRNPFIDNPYLATVFWGGADAENRWETLSVNSQEENNISMFPNPAKGNTVTILSKDSITVAVFDVLGKKVLSKTMTTNQKKLDISTLNAGVYIVRLSSKKGAITKKLIRQ